MALLDYIECNEFKDECREIRLLARMDAKDLYNESGIHFDKDLIPQDLIKTDSLLEKRYKALSLLHLLLCFQREHEDLFNSLMLEDESNIREYIGQELKCLGGRYMINGRDTLTYVSIEAVADSIMKNNNMHEKFYDLMEKTYPHYFQEEKNAVNSIAQRMGKRLKTALIKNPDKPVLMDFMEIAVLKYHLAWNWDEVEEKEEIALLKNAFMLSLMEEQSMLVEREAPTVTDWLEEKLEAEKGLLASAIFNKYKDKCEKQAAAWINNEIIRKKENIEDSEYPLLDCFKNCSSYILAVFNYQLDKLPKLHDSEIQRKAKLFGRTSLTFIINILAENKWYLKKRHMEEFQHQAYRLALASVVSTNAVVCFEGNIDELQKTNLIRRAELKNPELFVTNLFYAFVINLISIEFKEKDAVFFFQREKFLIGSTPIDIQEQAITSEYEYKKSEFELILDRKDSKIKALESQLKKLQDEKKDITKKATAPLIDTIRALERTNNKLNDSLHVCEEKLTQQNNLLEAYENMLEKNETEKIDKYTEDEIKAQRLLFVGGRYELLRTLKDNLPNAKFIQIETDPLVDMKKIDKIIFFSKFMNHSTYYKVFGRAKPLSIPFIFIHTQNIEKVMDILATKDETIVKGD